MQNVSSVLYVGIFRNSHLVYTSKFTTNPSNLVTDILGIHLSAGSTRYRTAVSVPVRAVVCALPVFHVDRRIQVAPNEAQSLFRSERLLTGIALNRGPLLPSSRPTRALPTFRTLVSSWTIAWVLIRVFRNTYKVSFLTISLDYFYTGSKEYLVNCRILPENMTHWEARTESYSRTESCVLSGLATAGG
jgi:hypothetical protein